MPLYSSSDIDLDSLKKINYVQREIILAFLYKPLESLYLESGLQSLSSIS